MRKYHIDGSKPSSDQIFVFGSNMSGFHGAGAARAAMDHYGAKWGVAEGITGGSYALPTVRELIEGPRTLDEVKVSVVKFLDYANENPNMKFFVTRVGCVLAGFSDAIIAPLFRNAPNNCSLPETWKPLLEV